MLKCAFWYRVLHGTEIVRNCYAWDADASKQINTKASKTGHTHDDRYYTKDEINANKPAFSTASSSGTVPSRYGTDTMLAQLSLNPGIYVLIGGANIPAKSNNGIGVVRLYRDTTGLSSQVSRLSPDVAISITVAEIISVSNKFTAKCGITQTSGSNVTVTTWITAVRLGAV